MKIICIGRNYIDHAKELNNPVPEHPLIFMKPPSALLVDKKPFYYPEFSKDIHYELELVIKICKNGRHVMPEFAASYYKEITLGIDMTARDIQSKLKSKGHPWEIAKGFDGSAILGQFIDITEDMRTHGILFELSKNDKIVQRGDNRDMIFSFEDIIVYASKYFKLQMGDLIYTGTPAGVGPVCIGDRLVGSIGELELCEVTIR